MFDRKLLGALIKSQRCKKKLTQLELAKQTGLSRSYISDIENGRYIPGASALTSLAICIDLDLNLLKMTEIQGERTTGVG
ncbi:ImmF control region 10 kDa protein [Bacillus licheniformis]|uniref:helix-turn-helix domain-containing protein n=1 Tax=Bacillus licheniformis TaxID=1402 RepID=UPI00084B9A49|nr:helix-turn-helix transcriptional regulator [Bacillus licheniformis]AOP16151.1 ImmF control region 10 kDa protein [Bacillus licheniformis]